jgi:hypothetical protein
LPELERLARDEFIVDEAEVARLKYVALVAVAVMRDRDRDGESGNERVGE